MRNALTFMWFNLLIIRKNGSKTVPHEGSIVKIINLVYENNNLVDPSASMPWVRDSSGRSGLEWRCLAHDTWINDYDCLCQTVVSLLELRSNRMRGFKILWNGNRLLDYKRLSTKAQPVKAKCKISSKPQRIFQNSPQPTENAGELCYGHLNILGLILTFLLKIIQLFVWDFRNIRK